MCIERGYLNVQDILDKVSEYDIFKLIFGYTPILGVYVTSPFRQDKTPGCWFTLSSKGKLYFVDFGNKLVINGIKLTHVDCFNAVQLHYGFENFYQTLDFVYGVFITKDIKIDGLIIKPTQNLTKQVIKIQKPFEIYPEYKNFSTLDSVYWQHFGVTSGNLKEDKVYSVNRALLLNTKKGDLIIRYDKICYAYTNFKSGHLKLYNPYNTKKFTTNCTSNDIGELENLPKNGKKLVITKSYKDCRILRNFGVISIWFQNEGQIPSNKLLSNLIEKFDDIVILFDNDRAGIVAAKTIKDHFKTQLNKVVETICLPIQLYDLNITDIADLYLHKSKKAATQFLKNNDLIK